MCHRGIYQEPTLQENKAYSTKGLSDKQKEPELNIRTYQVHILAVQLLLSVNVTKGKVN